MERKQAKGLSPRSIERYLDDLKAFNLNLQTATEQEIRSRLAYSARKYSKAGNRRTHITIKQVLTHLGRKELAEAIELPHPSESRVVTYSKQDIEALLKAAAGNLRNRLLIQILAETGARRGELHNMRIKDVQFDQYSPIIWLHGKTGTRTRRVYVSRLDLIRYLEEHPQRGNAEAPFWVTEEGNKLAYEGLYKIIRKIGWAALKRNIYPHGFRHTAATKDASLFTDREMMLRYGWKRSDMVQVYAHLTARDVDAKDLTLHGLKPKATAQEPLIETRKCFKCKSENAPIALYCQNCGHTLTQNAEDVQDLRGEVQALRIQLQQILNSDTKG